MNDGVIFAHPEPTALVYPRYLFYITHYPFEQKDFAQIARPRPFYLVNTD